MGFLKFLGAIALMILGAMVIMGTIGSCLGASLANPNLSLTPYILFNILGVIIGLGGAYYLRHH